ncbi:MAG: glycoside hydrolase/phage tail family protein, partial [Pseudomonadota bacterium]
DRKTDPLTWRAGGETRATAHLISQDAEGRANFGGSPSDLSIKQAIEELKDRGYRVTIYPFVMLDVPPGNGLPDPWGWGAEQPAFPWRGRITTDFAPGQSGSTDGTSAAADEVAAFFGATTPAQLSWTGDTVSANGADDGYRRFVLSLARIAEAAGGVDAFVIGSEFRSLTQIRSGAGAYPAVDALCALAADVRAILGPDAKLTYAADWSEYFGHQPPDGSGDVYFHLDPLWADPEIDAVGVDAYFPLSDWADDGDPAAPDAPSIYDLDYLRSRVEGGEAYDYYYASDADRAARVRPAITDGAYGEPWIFRPKDLRGWWSNPHHDRPGGVRSETPTAWIPESKPIWFTEIGCPAVDRGANQPNKFADLKSSESALPFASRGMRDDFIQRRFLQAVLGYWGESGEGAANPVSGLTGAPMIDLGYAAVWAWDARPWPDFPLRETIWADGPNQPTGHWIQGRLGSAPLADLVAEIAIDAGLEAADLDLTRLTGVVDGYLADRVMSPRELLQPLMLAFAFDAAEAGGRIRFSPRGAPAAETLTLDALVVDEEDPESPIERIREDAAAPAAAIRLGYVDGAGDYRAAALEARSPTGLDGPTAQSDAPIVLSAGAALSIAERHLAEAALARDAAQFRLPPSALRFEPGDVVSLALPAGVRDYRLSRVADADAREIEAVRVEASVYAPVIAPEPVRTPADPVLAAPPEVAVLDLPLLTGAEIPHAPTLAATLSPWPGPLALWRSASDDGYTLDALLTAPATLGALLDPLPPARPWLWTRHAPVRISVTAETLQSRGSSAVLDGANALAVEAVPGVWEVLQFQIAELIEPGVYALSSLLRGQAGTEASCGDEIPAGARIVLLDAALRQPSLALETLGLTRHYRIGAAGRAPDPDAFAHIVHAAAGIGLRPYAPVHLRARPAAAGGVALSWIRRTRQGGDLWDGYDAPLGEAFERYRLRIERLGATVIERATDAPHLVLSAGDLPARPFSVAVAQISALFGPGADARIELL